MAFGVRAKAAAADPSAVEFADETAPEAFPEIDCVRSILPAGVAAAAEQRAGRLGVGADRVLIAGGTINEDDYLRSLADHLGVPFEPLEGMPRNACPVGDDRVIEAAAMGLLPLTVDDEPFVVVAPRGVAARRLIAMIEGDPTLVRRFRFTSAERLRRFVLRYAGKALTARACDQLKQTWPMLSAAPPRWRTNLAPLVVVAGVTIAAAVMAPAITSFALELMLGAMFLAWLMLRLVGVFINGTAPTKALDVADDALPVYSIIAALYREAASVDGLLRAIERLDYPAEKLDVIIAVEADDHETRATIAARSNRISVTVIPVAAGGPRTKPKALNFALPFARGTFTVIYDAEDRPQPGQLRRVLQAFRTGGDELACVQARLCIDNTADSSLTRLFTAEYAGQFDVFLPGLAASGLPLPLGGSSNHFHNETLRKIGAWDPYNVTEDADLGMRLARFGYRSEVIDSTTYEEAPAHFGPWLRQRTRWFKGWMQTWLVHMRQPPQLLRDLGLPGFVAFQLIVGGNVLAALVHPLFLASLIYYSALQPTSAGSGDMSTILTWVYSASVAIGYVTSAFIGGLGLKRRGLLANAWVLLLTPLHWLLLSLAAWRAFYQLVVAPYAWEKTEHGLAKSSRLAANLTRSLLELERYFKRHKEAGDLPVVNAARNTSAARRRRPRAAA